MIDRVIIPATIAALFAGIFALLSLGLEITHFFDPCFRWAGEGGAPDRGQCPTNIQSTSETKLNALMRLSLIQGGILIAATIGLWGAIRNQPILPIVSAVILFLESIPLVFGGLAILTLFTSGMFAWSARSIAPFQGSAKLLLRALGILASLTAVMLLIRLFIPIMEAQDAFSGLGFGLILIALLAFNAIVAWWPEKKRLRT